MIEYPFVKGLPDYPLIIPVLKMPHERHNFGGVWHTDTTYLKEPPSGTMISVRELPPFGGDTLFASSYAAFESLSLGLVYRQQDLKAVNSSAKAAVTKTREDRLIDSATAMAGKALESLVHPVVRTHPETGRRSLYINPGHTVRFAGWTEEECAPAEVSLRISGETGIHLADLSGVRGQLLSGITAAFCNNPVNDYHGHKRLMHRITLKGDVPA